MKTNLDKTVIQSVQGCIAHPKIKNDGYWVGYDGKGRINMSTGGITYNFKIGDCCMGIAGDHIEPGVSLKNPNDAENNAMMSFSCIGNEACVLTGEAKGKKGYVSGKHGGVNHVMICFEETILNQLHLNDWIEIKIHGQGLKLLDYPNISIMNLDPQLLLQLPIQEKNHQLYIPVVAKIPAYLMGAGLGSTTLFNGDYDIMTQDKNTIEQLQLHTLRFGDFVYIEDHLCTYGPHYQKGSASIGVITHSDSYTSGHGPGVTIIMSASNQQLQPILDSNANLANYMKSQKNYK